MLTLGIVYSNHREFQNAVFLHRFKANDTGSGFFAPTQYGFSQIRTLAVDHLHQVSSVVDYDMRLMFQAHFDVPHIFFIRSPVVSEYCKAFICQCSRHIILGRKTVAARYRHLCAACSQHQAKICRLGFQVHRKADTQSLKRFCGTEFLFQAGQQRHIVLDPLDLSVSGRRQGNISDIVLIVHPKKQKQADGSASLFLSVILIIILPLRILPGSSAYRCCTPVPLLHSMQRSGEG